MASHLFARKPLKQLLEEMQGEQRLRRVLGPVQLTSLGVGAVIPPWNFPLAIMAGMTTAAIVSGNTVILKPSGDAPTIAAVFFSILEQAGLPDGVVNFCPGAGSKFGSAVVAHPQTRFIAFTGSKAVGLDIHERPDRRDIIEVGDVVTIEPGLYFPDRAIGVRIEDTFVVREGGVESLCRASYGLRP